MAYQAKGFHIYPCLKMLKLLHINYELFNVNITSNYGPDANMLLMLACHWECFDSGPLTDFHNGDRKQTNLKGGNMRQFFLVAIQFIANPCRQFL